MCVCVCVCVRTCVCAHMLVVLVLTTTVYYCHGECGPGFASLSFSILFLARNPDFTGSLIFKMSQLKIFKHHGPKEMYLLVRYGYHLVISDLDDGL